MVQTDGKLLIGFDQRSNSHESFRSVNPATGAALDHVFFKASESDVNLACEKATHLREQTWPAASILLCPDKMTQEILTHF